MSCMNWSEIKGLEFESKPWVNEPAIRILSTLTRSFLEDIDALNRTCIWVPTQSVRSMDSWIQIFSWSWLPLRIAILSSQVWPWSLERSKAINSSASRLRFEADLHLVRQQVRLARSLWFAVHSRSAKSCSLIVELWFGFTFPFL